MKKTWIAAFGLAAAVTGLLVAVVTAGRSASYAVDWQVLNAGGAAAASGQVKLSGSLGQTAVGRSASASYTATSGYWLAEGAPPRVRMYLPIARRAAP